MKIWIIIIRCVGSFVRSCWLFQGLGLPWRNQVAPNSGRIMEALCLLHCQKCFSVRRIILTGVFCLKKTKNKKQKNFAVNCKCKFSENLRFFFVIFFFFFFFFLLKMNDCMSWWRCDLMEFSFLLMYLLACQVVTTGDSGLFCCVHVMSFDHQCVCIFLC